MHERIALTILPICLYSFSLTKKSHLKSQKKYQNVSLWLRECYLAFLSDKILAYNIYIQTVFGSVKWK